MTEKESPAQKYDPKERIYWYHIQQLHDLETRLSSVQKQIDFVIGRLETVDRIEKDLLLLMKSIGINT